MSNTSISRESYNQIIDEMKKIIDTLTSTDKISIDKLIPLEILDKTSNSLRKILYRLQFELLRAKENKDWKLQDLLHKAIHQCEDTINMVNAHRINSTVGEDHEQIISNLKQLRVEINTAIQNQQMFNFFISLAGLVRKFVV